MTTKTAAIISPSGSGETFEAFGSNILRIKGQQTGGSISVMEVIFPSSAETPLHIHEREDELFRVLSGQFAFWCGDDYVELDEDGVIFLPRNVPHRVRNIGSADGRVMVTLSPGGFEEFFVRVAGGADPEATALEFGLLFR